MTCDEFRSELDRVGKTPEEITILAHHAAVCPRCTRRLRWVCVSTVVQLTVVPTGFFGVVAGLIYLAFWR